MFGMEHEEVIEYDRLRQDYQGKYLSLRKTLVMLNFGQSAIQTSGLGICVILAAFSAAKGLITPGDFVLVNAYVIQLFQPLFVSIFLVVVHSFSAIGLLLTFFLFCLGRQILVPWHSLQANYPKCDRP